MSAPVDGAPSRKRQRSSTVGKDEDEDARAASPGPFIHHPHLWFKDGNVVIIAGDTAFKVYYGILIQRSEVLEARLAAVFSNEHPVLTYSACPALRLEEHPEDVALMLTWLFGIARTYPGCMQLSLQTVASYLRMGSTYSIAGLRNEAITRLSACYPTGELEEFDAINRNSFKRPIEWQEDMDVAVASLAREQNLHDLLPLALYEACWYGRTKFLDRLDSYRQSIRPPTKSQAELLEMDHWLLRAYVRFRPNLVSARKDDVYHFLVCQHHEECLTPGDCAEALETLAVMMGGHQNAAHPLQSVVPFINRTSACSECKPRWKKQSEEARRDVWNGLHTFFDLPAPTAAAENPDPSTP